MIKFKEHISMVVVDEYDDATDNIVSETVENFKPGDVVDAEIVSEDGNYVDLQFGVGGGVAFGVLKSLFEIV
jgi:exosome complex RNA-binding protein Csl4